MITAVATDSGVEGDRVALVPWWSFGKTVLAAAALVLVGQGRLSLDTAWPGRAFTLRQLLQHRAGLPDYGDLAAYHQAVAARETPWPVDVMLAQLPSGGAAGSGWRYSNVGYLLVRQAVEQAMDAPLGVALRLLVLDRLEIAGVFVANEPEDLVAAAWGNSTGYHPGWVYHGLLVGTASAAALLLHRLLAGRLLPATLLGQMRAARPVGGAVPDRPWRIAGYGLGLMVGVGEPAGIFTGHTGGGPVSSAAIFQLHPGRTASAFANAEAPGPVERRAMALASPP